MFFIKKLSRLYTQSELYGIPGNEPIRFALCLEYEGKKYLRSLFDCYESARYEFLYFTRRIELHPEIVLLEVDLSQNWIESHPKIKELVTTELKFE